MVEDFIESYVKKIVAEPDKIRVLKREVDTNFYEIEILTSLQDAGRLIGKDGKMISAIKTFISGVKAKDGSSYRIAVKPQ
ncbi:KH domain-containing protein [Helicobacter sp.]|uniref:KH domain-containing protein n=1 Tax=Helicobacter sp. TaxID=218 RepID=UPI0025BBCF9C|nr:KH domain-containing protein [Helicobacter sp.]MCI5967902.1 KH domain-containing protein [Helicobacter sp.]MDY2584803.1 KH domain-containing protein [Helicobacter sp.]